MHFLLACNLSSFLGSEIGYKSKLLVERHAYWKYFKVGKYRRSFSKIYYFDRYVYPSPQVNIFKNIVYSLMMFPRFLFLKRKLQTLKISSNDFVFTVGGCTFLEDMILGNFQVFKKILILPYQNYVSQKDESNLKEYRTNIAIEIVQLIKNVFGMTETIWKYKKNVKILGEGDYYLGTQKSLNKIYDNIILTVGDYRGFIKKNKERNVFLAKYPSLVMPNQVYKSEKKKIIFLGTDFLGGTNGDPRVFIKEINKYLDYLRYLYKESYELVYKPHPREGRESRYLNLKDFVMMDDRGPAEIFFLENKQNIKSVFSFYSTASQVAYFMGIDSYVFFRIFPFDKVRRLDIEDFFSILPSECFIADLKTYPKHINRNKDDRGKNFQNVIRQSINQS